MRALPVISFAAVLEIAASGCGPVLPDRTICTKIESTPVRSGGRSAVPMVLVRQNPNASSTATTPYSAIPITLTAVGGIEGDPDYDLRVCVPDCVTAADSAFKKTVTTETSDTGLFIHTVLAGTKTVGTVLVDFGSVTCLESIAPAMTQ